MYQPSLLQDIYAAYWPLRDRHDVFPEDLQVREDLGTSRQPTGEESAAASITQARRRGLQAQESPRGQILVLGGARDRTGK